MPARLPPEGFSNFFRLAFILDLPVRNSSTGRFGIIIFLELPKRSTQRSKIANVPNDSFPNDMVQTATLARKVTLPTRSVGCKERSKIAYYPNDSFPAL